jgi:hypothetical protein
MLIQRRVGPEEASVQCAARGHEIVCFSLEFERNADGFLDVSGGRDVNHDDYTQLPKGNLDVTGRYLHLDDRHGRRQARRVHREGHSSSIS